MKKALSVVLALAIMVSCLSMIAVFAEDSVYGKNLLSEAESTFTDQTAVPAAWKGLESTLSIETDPTDPDNKVLKATTAKSWSTPYIEVGTLIKEAIAAAGLTQASVRLSMRVYVEDPDLDDVKEATARLILRDTKNASFCSDQTNNYATLSGNVYTGTKFNQWYTVSADLFVSAADLATINSTNGNSWRLCLDNIKSTSYLLIDDVSVTLEEKAGAQITVSEGQTVDNLATTASAGFLSGAEVNGETVKASIIVSNESAIDFYAQFNPSVLHHGSSDSWEAMAVGEFTLVPAGKSVELSVNVPVKKTIEKNGTTKEYTYDKDVFIRVNVSTDASGKTPLPSGTVLYLSGNSGTLSFSKVFNCAAKLVSQSELPESVNNLYTGEEDGGTNEEPIFAEVVNGNAEDGTTGWGIFLQGKGTVEQVAGGANGTAHAIKFTPSQDGKYDSVAFDLGPAIIQDQENGYNGAGAGEYTVTFYAKTDAPLPSNTSFAFILNSQEHVNGKLPDGTEQQSFITVEGAGIKLTEDWTKFEVKVPITENYLTLIKQLYAEGKTNAYQLILRLDGSINAFASETFAYYVDEVTIQAPGSKNDGDVAPIVAGTVMAAACVSLGFVIVQRKRKELL